MNQSDPLFDDVRLIRTLFPDKPADVTEYNRLDPSAFSTTLHALGANSACFFLLGGTPDQSQYDLLKQPTYYQSFKEWQPMATNPPPAPTFSVGPGVAAKLAEKGDTAKSDERYIGDVFSLTAGGKGLYVYVKEANQTYFLAAS